MGRDAAFDRARVFEMGSMGDGGVLAEGQSVRREALCAREEHAMSEPQTSDLSGRLAAMLYLSNALS